MAGWLLLNYANVDALVARYNIGRGLDTGAVLSASDGRLGALPALEELLEAQPDFWVQVSPVGPEERIHLVEAQVSMEQEVSMRDEVFGLFEEMDQEARRKEYEDCGFPRQLDALVELARAARDAVTAWPMPMKPL